MLSNNILKMINFRKPALLITSLIIIVILLTPILFEGPLRQVRGIKNNIIPSANASFSFTDLNQNEEALYNKYINNLFNKHFISGYTSGGVSTGKFGPNGLLKRSELAKISTVVKLSEVFGEEENWDDKNKANMFFAIDDKLKPFYGCDNTDLLNCDSKIGADIYGICNVCVNNGYQPFLDVKEKEKDCALYGVCSPWYSQYIYYASRKGFINGYTTNSGKIFKPNDYIPRIYALKMIIVDDGNIEPEQDERYKRLSSQSSNTSCLSGAEQYILNNNANNTKLLKYALLADKLGLFGNECEVFNRSGAYSPNQRASFLQQNLTRKETARYFSLTTSYEPLNIGVFETGDKVVSQKPNYKPQATNKSQTTNQKENKGDENLPIPYVSTKEIKQDIITNQASDVCKFNPSLCVDGNQKLDINNEYVPNNNLLLIGPIRRSGDFYDKRPKIPKRKEDIENNLPTMDFWYTVIPNWHTVNDGLWGGVFKEKRYSKDSKIGFLFPTKEGGKYKELIVKVIGGIAEDYDETDPNAERNKKAMIKNYRTTRWYEIKYDGKTGWVPVSATVLKNDIFKITINGKYIYDYYHIIHNRGYKNTSESNINKLLLHNTAGSTASSLIKGINSPPHYYLGREHRFDKNAEMDNRFAGYIPEYLNSGTVNSTGYDIEKKSISIEMVNWSWLNPSKKTDNKKDQEIINGDFNKFDFEKLKNYKIIYGENYLLVNYYFSENNGFFESYNLKTKKEKDIFNKFFVNPKNNKNSYTLKEKYQEIIDNNLDIYNEINPIYEVLNKIPFNYNFYNYLKKPYSEINNIIDVTGTYPFKVYTLNNASKAQRLTDGEIAHYYERYTPEQYKNLNIYINHINYKYGFPSTTFNYNLPNNIPKKYGFYMYDTSISWENMKKKTLDSKDGIFSHRSIQQGGKMCPAPGFQIDRISNLNN